jgi:hypothetical protein
MIIILNNNKATEPHQYIQTHPKLKYTSSSSEVAIEIKKIRMVM